MRRYVDISANYFTIRFNSRTREGCDFIYPLDAVWHFAFQFPHPGGVRLRDRDPRLAVDDVSIHAPGRGATRIRPHVRHTHDVSIHAPGRGATLYLCRDLEDKQSFNSRTREGCDPCRCVGDRGELYVSIHAPGRGATHLRHGASMGGQSFNSRTREGCDFPTRSVYLLSSCFNSRTREGCDYAPPWLPRRYGVSIHAPGRGATKGRYPTIDEAKVSIHAPGRGATHELIAYSLRH